MEIGEVIRKYRKERNMTQEEMAKRLGVTAPAVNKWERGKGQPDISLLAPIARLLGITLEVLLSYNEQLSNDESNKIAREVSKKFEIENYNSAFCYVSDIIKQYPNCFQLIWQIALIADAHLSCGDKETEDKEACKNQIVNWYKQAMESDDSGIKREAAGSLFGYYIDKEDYMEAEKYLQYFSEEGAERKRKQAVLYSKTNRTDEAYKTYEEILFSEYHMLKLVMDSLAMLSIQKNNINLAGKWIGKESSLAALFDMGKYNTESCKLDLAIYNKDIQATSDIVKTVLDSISSNSMTDYTKSFMYSHMEFKDLDPSFYPKLRESLLKYFNDKETFGYMEGNPGWKSLIKV
ncbi:MAG: helix-turn-helix transcriptional regulator [Lachnospiraceae bacterium]|nr:helix-turn-helix transcriptional regulator [Lachnospiraceae bacterium]